MDPDILVDIDYDILSDKQTFDCHKICILPDIDFDILFDMDFAFLLCLRSTQTTF